MGEVIRRFEVRSRDVGEDIVEEDVILLWSEQRRIVTGTDILGRLLRGIARFPTLTFAEGKEDIGTEANAEPFERPAAS